MPKKVNGKMDYSNVKIIHHFADGVVKESLKGVRVPLNDTTKLFYKTLYKILSNTKKTE